MRNLKVIFLCVACFTTIFHLTTSTDHTVGGQDGGWDIGVDMKSWADNQKFFIGDSLIFSYQPFHDVLEVSEQNYESCTVANAFSRYTGGSTTIQLKSHGTRYFICGVARHCTAGMKLQVDILPSASSPPPPSSPPSPIYSPPPPSTTSPPPPPSPIYSPPPPPLTTANPPPPSPNNSSPPPPTASSPSPPTASPPTPFPTASPTTPSPTTSYPPPSPIYSSPPPTAPTTSPPSPPPPTHSSPPLFSYSPLPSPVYSSPPPPTASPPPPIYASPQLPTYYYSSPPPPPQTSTYTTTPTSSPNYSPFTYPPESYMAPGPGPISKHHKHKKPHLPHAHAPKKAHALGPAVYRVSMNYNYASSNNQNASSGMRSQSVNLPAVVAVMAVLIVLVL